MPKVTHFQNRSTLTEYSAEETMRSIQLCAQAAERVGRDRDVEKDERYPSIQDVSQVVAWAFAYAPEDKPLDKTHPMWEPFFAHSEWFRTLIVGELNLPVDTKWEEIYKLSGFNLESEYESEEKFWEAYHFGAMTMIRHDDADRKLDELEHIKYQIVGRI